MVVGVLLCFYFGTAFIDRNVAPAVEASLPWSSVPPQGVEAAAQPLGTPPAVEDSTAYRLLEPPDSSQPFAAYDPCRPIHYVIRRTTHHRTPRPWSTRPSRRSPPPPACGSPTAGSQGGPSNAREAYQPDVYGKRWAPVLIAWSSPAESPRLAGDVAGLGGSATVKETGTPYVCRVSGQIELDGPDLAETLVEPYGQDRVQAVIMHELGHVLGLGHVDDPSQLMYGGPNSVTELQDGDRAGLAVLGSGACVPQL